METPTPDKLLAMHFHGWKNGLSTGMYYLRSEPSRNAIQFTLDGDLTIDTSKQSMVCSEDVCTACTT